MKVILLALLGLLLVLSVSATDYFEQLNLTPLPLGSLLASFEFRSNESLSAYQSQNFRYFPRSLGQVLQSTDTKELHLRFTTGRWDTETWGARPWNGTKEGGTGVELWAWIESDTEHEAMRKWLVLNQALSGLFCASLNFVDETRTTKPALSFQPRGTHDNSSNLHLLHGVLPGEVVCTENLTPFIKLLPCKGKAGISSLLDGHKVFDSSWQNALETPAWSLNDVFGRQAAGSCPLAETEGPEAKSICLNVPHSQGVWIGAGGFEVRSPPGVPEKRCYQLVNGEPFDFDMPKTSVRTHQQLAVGSELIKVERTMTGHGAAQGGMRTVLTNPLDTSVDLVMFESLPWFLRPYMHTLTATMSASSMDVDVVKDIYYRPAIDRHRGSQIELLLSIPPLTSITLTYSFEKSILRYTEYPPDANRGFIVAPAVIRILNQTSPVYVRTTSLLLSLPTPDFSMPYNVIILTSTVMALAFGSIFNILVRRFVGLKEVPESGIGKAVKRVRGRIVALRRRAIGKEKKEE
ncbi:Subunit of the glycosylphosphatidylinositol transamidase complex-like protein [Lithohypha guttulata]|uniref:Subunit of the glycosylphosphatidylinositol transamidase complex-like protein n=1 Tax=Lithohypha guttulata TaxID=1690604 RepID=A0AAN7STD7_9EURO|nr:Subunit of the glycosylphosphatidylinositol transamidase complex-like protein [Lithohypha guttulata]KAK5080988.1 Subunit of the glycosylphosphatidylinositol transamidase complex-like protein [Lithohypha guttulata]